MEPTCITDEVLLFLGTIAWFKMLLHMGTLSRLGPVITLVPSTDVPLSTVTEGFSTFERYEHSTGTGRFNSRLTGETRLNCNSLAGKSCHFSWVRDQTTNCSNRVYSYTRSVT